MFWLILLIIIILLLFFSSEKETLEHLGSNYYYFKSSDGSYLCISNNVLNLTPASSAPSNVVTFTKYTGPAKYYIASNVLFDSNGIIYTTPPTGTTPYCCNSGEGQSTTSTGCDSLMYPYIQYRGSSAIYLLLCGNSTGLFVANSCTNQIPTSSSYFYNNFGSINLTNTGTQITGSFVSK